MSGLDRRVKKLEAATASAREGTLYAIHQWDNETEVDAVAAAGIELEPGDIAYLLIDLGDRPQQRLVAAHPICTGRGVCFEAR